jgi:hypothetical protein
MFYVFLFIDKKNLKIYYFNIFLIKKYFYKNILYYNK